MYEIVSFLLHAFVLLYMGWELSANPIWKLDLYEGRFRLNRKSAFVLILGIVVAISLGSKYRIDR